MMPMAFDHASMAPEFCLFYSYFVERQTDGPIAQAWLDAAGTRELFRRSPVYLVRLRNRQAISQCCGYAKGTKY